jgi:hypothetical protein
MGWIDLLVLISLRDLAGEGWREDLLDLNVVFLELSTGWLILFSDAYSAMRFSERLSFWGGMLKLTLWALPGESSLSRLILLLLFF